MVTPWPFILSNWPLLLCIFSSRFFPKFFQSRLSLTRFLMCCVKCKRTWLVVLAWVTPKGLGQLFAAERIWCSMDCCFLVHPVILHIDWSLCAEIILRLAGSKQSDLTYWWRVLKIKLNFSSFCWGIVL